jgi:hypothetical protein
MLVVVAAGWLPNSSLPRLLFVRAKKKPRPNAVKH